VPSAGGGFGYKGRRQVPLDHPEQSMDAKIEQRAARQPRLEDDALVRSNGRYAADVPLPNQAYATFVRSPHAFARIVRLDVSAALARPTSSAY
jgi:xanthine dehydrogenase molybdopterin-binding subunit B